MRPRPDSDILAKDAVIRGGRDPETALGAPVQNRAKEDTCDALSPRKSR